MTDAERIEQIKERLKAATPGPWEWKRGDDTPLRSVNAPPNVYVVHGSADAGGGQWFTECEPADRAFIANAPNDVAWLLDQLAASKDEVAALNEAITELRASYTFRGDALRAAEAREAEALKRAQRAEARCDAAEFRADF